MSKQPAPAVTQLRDAEGVKRDNSYQIDPRAIIIEDGHNYRQYDLPENKAHVQQLKESIRIHGVKQPVWVRLDGGVIKLVDGESRLRATLELIAEGCEIDFIPAIAVKGNEQQRLEQALIANGSKSPSSWEVGVAYQRFINWGWTEDKIAERMGVPVKFVKEALKLAEATPEVKHLLSEAAVTPSAAIWAIKGHGDKASLVLKAQVEEKKKKAASKPAAKKNGKSAKPAKSKPVGREKKQNGVFVPFKTLEVIRGALADMLDEKVSAEVTEEQCQNALKLVEKLLPKKEEK